MDEFEWYDDAELEADSEAVAEEAAAEEAEAVEEFADDSAEAAAAADFVADEADNAEEAAADSATDAADSAAPAAEAGGDNVIELLDEEDDEEMDAAEEGAAEEETCEIVDAGAKLTPQQPKVPPPQYAQGKASALGKACGKGGGPGRPPLQWPGKGQATKDGPRVGGRLLKLPAAKGGLVGPIRPPLRGDVPPPPPGLGKGAHGRPPMPGVPGHLQRMNSEPGLLKRKSSLACVNEPHLKKVAIDTSSPSSRLRRPDEARPWQPGQPGQPTAAMDNQGRQYDLAHVVVNFANVGSTYAVKVLKKQKGPGVRLFDWEGVRQCITKLKMEYKMRVVGVVFENFLGPDRGSRQVEVPNDIKQMCESIQETPRISGDNHSSADDEMTIKCAYARNCRFMDNDNYRDWKAQLRDDKVRAWLEKCQDLLQMRYFFDSGLGHFDTLDGNIPPGLLAPTAGGGLQRKVSKKELWTAPRN